MLSDLLQNQMAEKSRNQQRLGIIYFDLDGFKPVNDTLGHLAGDQVLCEIADRVRKALGPNDTVARLGGDEFTIVLDNPENAEVAVATARKISHLIRQPIIIENTKVCVTSSMGISLFPDHARQMEELLKGADAAMYKAKSAGKDQVCLFSRQTLELTDRMASLETSMSCPLYKQQLQLHYQPIVNTNTNEIESVEALIRWEHPTLGIIFPNEFIPIAEKSNHILDIGGWVLEKVCEQKRAWLDEGIEINIAINISARQFFETDFADQVAACLKKHTIPASSIELEITESTVMIDYQRCRETLHQLKAMGHTITVDDFGTGYSALARLAQLPVSRLKIDRMFIKDIDACGKMKSLVKSIINMAHELELQVISEGIEKKTQLQSILDMKSDFFQGFLISTAKAAIEISSLLSSNAQSEIERTTNDTENYAISESADSVETSSSGSAVDSLLMSLNMIKTP
jgi:diguanylate cyclase (GGDEF)-like protein